MIENKLVLVSATICEHPDESLKVKVICEKLSDGELFYNLIVQDMEFGCFDKNDAYTRYNKLLNAFKDVAVVEEEYNLFTEGL